MSDETAKEVCFVDSNIWLYILLPGQDDQKAAIAKELIRREGLSIHLSAQVVSEVVYGVIRHAALNEAEIRELVGRLYALRNYADHRNGPVNGLANARRLRAILLG